MKVVWTLIMMQVFVGSFTKDRYFHTFIETFDTKAECLEAYELMVEMTPELEGEITQSGCFEAYVPQESGGE